MGFTEMEQALHPDDTTGLGAGLDIDRLTTGNYIITGYNSETYLYIWDYATTTRLDEFSGRTNSAVVIAKTTEPTQISSLLGTGAKTHTYYPIGDPFIGISQATYSVMHWEVAYENSELTALLSKFGVPENPILTNAQVLALTLNSVFTNMAEMLLNTQIESSQTFKRIEQKTLTSEQITPATLSAQEASAQHVGAAGAAVPTGGFGTPGFIPGTGAYS
jgi:hypothetical protein